MEPALVSAHRHRASPAGGRQVCSWRGWRVFNSLQIPLALSCLLLELRRTQKKEVVTREATRGADMGNADAVAFVEICVY